MLTPMTGKYRDLQRVTIPYARILGITNGELLEDIDMH